MKLTMTRHGTAAALLAFVAPFALVAPAARAQPASGAASAPSAQGASQSAGATRPDAAANAEAIRRRAEANQRANAPRMLSAEDTRFMQRAAALSGLMVQAGNIGLRRAVDPAVHGLAQTLVAHHEALAGEVERMARDHHARLGGENGSDGHAALLKRLATTGGFDSVFVREVGIAIPRQAIAQLAGSAGPAGAAAAGGPGAGSAAAPAAQSEAAPGGRGEPEDPAAWRPKFVQTLRDDLATAQQIPLRNAPDRTPNSSTGQGPAVGPAR